MTLEAEDLPMLQRLLAAHDPAALEYLYPYARLLEVVLQRRFGDLIAADDRQDIVADALLHAYETGQRFDPARSSIKTWMIMLAVYQAREFLRRHDARSIPLDLVDPVVLPTEHAVPAAPHPGVTLQRLLAQLPARRAHILELYYYEEQPMTEIAARLHISVAAVKSHLSHARSDLRRELEADLALA